MTQRPTAAAAVVEHEAHRIVESPNTGTATAPRPVSPPGGVPVSAWPPLPPHGLPLTPPRFFDPEERMAYKAWWVEEFARRIEVYRRAVPSQGYPSQAEVVELLDEFYEMGLPKDSDEDWSDHRSRRKRWRQILGTLTAGFQAPIHRILTVGDKA